MKVICTQENLRVGLGKVARVIGATNTLPILSNVLMRAESGILRLSATNLEVAVVTEVRCKVEDEGSTTVLARTFTDLVNNLPNTNVSLETSGLTLKLEAEHYQTFIKTLPAEEFPLIPEVEPRLKLSVPAVTLQEAIAEVSFAASTNQTQPEITGILFSIERKVLKLVGTDRYRLAEKTVKLPGDVGGPLEVIVPQRTCTELSRILGPKDGDVEIVFGDTQVAFSASGTRVVSRTIDGQYPPYQQIVPSEFTTTVLVPRQALVSALRAGSVFSSSASSVVVSFDPDKQALEVASESAELGSSRVEIPSEVSGQAGKLLLNFRYLQECLSATSAEKVKLKVTGETSAAILEPEGDPSYLYLVMPIKS